MNKNLVERFHLVRFFSFGALIMFVVVAAALIYFEKDQAAFFRGVQDEQNLNFQQVQKKFTDLQDEVARRDLLAIHESGNVNLTRLFANALWESHFAPFVARASQTPLQHCRDMPNNEINGKSEASPEKKACFDAVGDQVMALKGFPEINTKVFNSMAKSSVLKIKVFDTRGLTVYSSDHSQIGDDKSTNKGWQSAMKSVPASSLTHRGKFDAFEGTVEDRDVISSYLPVYKPGTDSIVGIFEVYSDVTKFLSTINNTSDQIKQAASNNQTRVEQIANANQTKVENSSTITITIVMTILVLLFGGLFLIVRKADQNIVGQAKEKEQAQQQLAQAEKMASLGQMVAGVAHQLNTPIAFSHSNVSMVKDQLIEFEFPLTLANQFATCVKKADADSIKLNIRKSRSRIEKVAGFETDTTILKEMLGDTLQGLEQMRELVENLRDFTRLDRVKLTDFDLNKGLKNVVYMARSVIPNEIELIEDYGYIPQVACNPSQLNQVFLNLVNNAAQSINGAGTVTVKSSLDGDQVRVEVSDTGSGIADSDIDQIFDNYYTTKSADEGTGLGLPIARNIVEEHGGSIELATKVGVGTTFVVLLPTQMNVEKAA